MRLQINTARRRLSGTVAVFRGAEPEGITALVIDQLPAADALGITWADLVADLVKSADVWVAFAACSNRLLH